VGRYHFFRLHPLTLGELDKNFERKTLERLLRFGGFPEPYFKADENEARRWRRERINRVVYQDLRDLQTVNELSLLELLVDMLPSRVGSTLSIKSLQEDLEVSPNTVSRWVEILEAIYYCYRILPYGPPKVRAVKKALAKGISAVVCMLEKDSLAKIFAGNAPGSVFLPKGK